MTRHKFVQSIFIVLMVASILVFPQTARAYSIALTSGESSAPAYSALENNIPTLTGFISKVSTADANTLTGVYIPGAFAFPVVQQPAYNAAYVSENPLVTT